MQVAQMLRRITAGDKAVDLLPILYTELCKLSRSMMAKTPPGNTLQTTALVHEAYMRLVGSKDPGWNGKGHFFGAAARAMRNILVDQARRKSRLKHGGDVKRVSADDHDVQVEPPTSDVLALNEALERLEADDPRKGEIVNLRYFAGLTAKETAAALGVSIGTIEREWRYIRAWLQAQLEG